MTGGHILGLILSLVITRFPALAAIVLTIIGQSKFVISMAESAVTIAGALGLRFFANKAFKLFGEHVTILLP